MFYVRQDGKINGPYSVDNIRVMVEGRKLWSTAEVHDENGQGLADLQRSSNWMSISQLLNEKVDANANQSGPNSTIVNRYRDAYRVSGVIVGLGTSIKVVGGILAALIAVISLASRSSFGLLGFLFAAAVGGLFWICGVIVAAQGQILQASLDTAVSSSPFMSAPERLDAMGLPGSIAER